MVKLGVNLGLLSIQADASELLNRLGDLSKPVVIVKRDAQGLALDTGLDDHSNASVLVWSLHCESHQLWFLDRRSNSTVSIRSAKTGLVLAGSRQMGNGTRVRMQEWSNKPWQKWFLRPVEEPRTFAIVSAVNEFGVKSMDVWEGAEHKSHVKVWDWWDGPPQKFMLLRPQDG